MSKQVTVEELAAHLREHIAEVQRGETIDITEDGRTIAIIRPAMVIAQRGVPYPFRDFDFGPRPEGLKIDAADLIIEEREYERSGKKYGV
jgi:hypothetical protein